MIIFLLFIPLFNFYDWKVTRSGGKPNYKKYNFIKTIAAVGCAFLMMDFSSLTRFFLSGVVVAIFELTSFWLVYELIRNLWSRRPLAWRELLYYDFVEHDSGKIDLFFSKHSWNFHALCKAIALVLAILSGIVIYHL